ncbi:MAG: 7-cyano-7-deazaguanine synthase QueC [Spirochaetes bacterium GWD1_27_9]|nr:MAG: 7-cyano-7-deazaguanine synthase QueC [Spirochaetes bacterium GWB1_27_13]OHD27863.1 MAG: 7-cyano-7-deazaguanine synthase QueC [Spirochaetes bacterium GWC1_27_15]OHD30871.1 MAG: 7-cyano-7-deazaguanine synthase QueC [Spirochaetes bacterium GWD1_27_9]
MIQSYNDEDALVLVSGGQDSVTCLFWALKNFKKVHCITFDYSQKHSKEIEIAQNICKKLGLTQKIVDISFLKDLVISNLFEGQNDVNEKHKLNENIPSSFVPYRNLIFLTLASAWASTINVKNIVAGVCQTDYSGYADCRDVFVKSAQTTLNLATDFKDKNVVIHTPLMWLTKCEEFKMADELGCLDFIINETLTCYNGVEKLNDFGKGCGVCPSCELRKKGFYEYKKKYQNSGNNE